MSLLDSPKLKSFINHRGLNPVFDQYPDNNFRKTFRKDFFKWLDEKKKTKITQKSSIGKFIETYLSDDLIIEIDSIQLAGGNGYDIILEKYSERWGRMI